MKRRQPLSSTTSSSQTEPERDPWPSRSPTPIPSLGQLQGTARRQGDQPQGRDGAEGQGRHQQQHQHPVHPAAGRRRPPPSAQRIHRLHRPQQARRRFGHCRSAEQPTRHLPEARAGFVGQPHQQLRQPGSKAGWTCRATLLLVPLVEIADPKIDINLNLSSYIERTEAEDLQGIVGHTRGGIPERDLDDHYLSLTPLHWFEFSEGERPTSDRTYRLLLVKCALASSNAELFWPAATARIDLGLRPVRPNWPPLPSGFSLSLGERVDHVLRHGDTTH